MKLLYISTFLFLQDNNKTYALPSCSDSFFQKYLDVFEEVQVLGEPMKAYLDSNSLVQMSDHRISVEIIKPNTSPKDFKNDKEVKKLLESYIKNAEAILIKPASRRGIMAIKIAKKYNKPYMIEMTGDIHNALRQHPNLLKRLYAPILYNNIKRAISDCKFGLYVSKDYLQKEFPIEGMMCGCSDVILNQFDDSILNNRLMKIDRRNDNDRIDLALVGFYQGKMKGVDTAIRALSHLDNRYHLSILGNGTEENRQKWYCYGEKFGISRERIHFPKPLPSSDAVLEWFDSIDAFVFPTRSEGFGRCVAEAMSRGCPCFATNICTMPELLPSECLHKLDDDLELSEMIKNCFSNNEIQKKLAIKNFNHAKEYEFSILKNRRNTFLETFKSYAEGKREN